MDRVKLPVDQVAEAFKVPAKDSVQGASQPALSVLTWSVPVTGGHNVCCCTPGWSGFKHSVLPALNWTVAPFTTPGILRSRVRP